MLGYIPPGTEYREVAVAAPARRHAAVIVYQPIAAAPSRDVFVPARYRIMLESLYSQCGLQRLVQVGSESLPTASATVEATFDPRRRLRRIQVMHAGRDLAHRVEDAEAGDDADVTHVDLSLADPSIDAAVDALRALGFFYCGLLPEQSGGDTLRLQRLRSPDPQMLQPQLATDGGRRLLAAMTADRGERPPGQTRPGRMGS